MWGDILLWFWVSFSWWLMILNIFSYVCWPSACFLWRNVYSSPLPIFNQVVCSLNVECMTSWNILDINPLSVASSANIFSHSVGHLFILLMVSFAVQKLLSLIRYHLFIFAFTSFALEKWSKKILLWFMSDNVLPMFSSRIFIYHVLHLGLQTILSLFFYMVWGSILTSLIYM